jgi:TPP-dependent pyruvate/acetoin dehydrogenase alpha subunit
MGLQVAEFPSPWELRRTDQVTVCFFGDDASNNGTFHEGLNLASLYKLPVIFVCENNLYGISVGQEKQRLLQDIALRAANYDMPGVVVDGNDVFEVHNATIKAVKRARAGEGPSLIECKTYRWRGHHEGDPNQGRRYRTTEEIESWKAKDPIERMAANLLTEKVVTKKKLDALKKQATEEIEEAVAYANESEFPALEEMYEDVYVQGDER